MCQAPFVDCSRRPTRRERVPAFTSNRSTYPAWIVCVGVGGGAAAAAAPVSVATACWAAAALAALSATALST